MKETGKTEIKHHGTEKGKVTELIRIMEKLRTSYNKRGRREEREREREN